MPRHSAAFLARLRAETRGAFEPLTDLEARAARWLQQAGATSDEHDGFLGFLAGHVKPTDAPDLEGLALADLRLSWGVLAGRAAPLAAFDRLLRGVLERERKRNPELDLDEVHQVVSRALLVAEPGKTPGLAGFSGRGPLEAWLRVVAVRELVRARKATRRSAPESDAALADRVAPTDDPELDFLKQRYRAEFRAAFADAVKGLDERQRNLLRHHFIDGLSIDELGARFDVHRATAARWLQKARDELAGATRAALLERLELSDGELDSLIRLVVTRLELSLGELKNA